MIHTEIQHKCFISVEKGHTSGNQYHFTVAAEE